MIKSNSKMISFDINNGGILTVHQDGHNTEIKVFSTNTGGYKISPGDFVTLLSWYRLFHFKKIGEG